MTPDVVYDGSRGRRGLGDASDMRGQDDLRVRPEPMACRQRFWIGDVDHRRRKVAAVERGDKGFVVELRPPAGVYERRAFRQFRKQVGIEQTARVFRQRQQADKYVAGSEHPLQPKLSMM